MVEAWHEGNGAVSKMNSDLSSPGWVEETAREAAANPSSEAVTRRVGVIIQSICFQESIKSAVNRANI